MYRPGCGNLEEFCTTITAEAGNPRYAGVVAAGDPVQAAHALQRGGYATDPAYADKLVAVMASIGPLDAGSPRSGAALVARSTP